MLSTSTFFAKEKLTDTTWSDTLAKRKNLSSSIYHASWYYPTGREKATASSWSTSRTNCRWSKAKRAALRSRCHSSGIVPMWATGPIESLTCYYGTTINRSQSISSRSEHQSRMLTYSTCSSTSRSYGVRTTTTSCTRSQTSSKRSSESKEDRSARYKSIKFTGCLITSNETRLIRTSCSATSSSFGKTVTFVN